MKNAASSAGQVRSHWSGPSQSAVIAFLLAEPCGLGRQQQIEDAADPGHEGAIARVAAQVDLAEARALAEPDAARPQLLAARAPAARRSRSGMQPRSLRVEEHRLGDRDRERAVDQRHVELLADPGAAVARPARARSERPRLGLM